MFCKCFETYFEVPNDTQNILDSRNNQREVLHRMQPKIVEYSICTARNYKYLAKRRISWVNSKTHFKFVEQLRPSNRCAKVSATAKTSVRFIFLFYATRIS